MRLSVVLAAFLTVDPLWAWSYFFTRRTDTSQPNTDTQPPSANQSQPNSATTTPTPIPRSTSRGQAISPPNGYQSSSPIPMQRPNGGMVKRAGSGQSFSLDRSYSEQDVIKRHSSQGVTSSFSPKGIFEATVLDVV